MALTQIRASTQLQALSITNSQIANPDAGNPNGILLTKIQNGALLIQSNGSIAFTAPVAGATPIGTNDLATKGYVDGVATGLDVKISVRAIATTNITLSATQTVDSVALVAGDRVLVVGQTIASQNGIYVVASGAWARAADAFTNAQVTSGMFTFVEQGTVNTGSGWVLTTANPITVGTTNLTFAQFSAAGVITAGNGLNKVGNVLNVVSANTAIVSSAGQIALTLADTTLAVAGGGLKLAALTQGQILIGNASSVATATVVSGDVSITAAGVVTIGAGAVTNTKIATATIGLDKLVGGTAGQLIIVGAGTVPAYVTASGDVTIGSTGAITISALAVGTSKIADASVTLTKMTALATGQIIIGTATGNAAVTVSGDITLSSTGIATLNTATVVSVASIVTRETPAGTIDGVNTTYTLAFTPKVGTESVYINGMLMDQGAGNDYTISGATITLLFALNAGDKIRCSYFK